MHSLVMCNYHHHLLLFHLSRSMQLKNPVHLLEKVCFPNLHILELVYLLFDFFSKHRIGKNLSNTNSIGQETR